MAAKLFSIVTISFNQKHFLKQTIESVLAQKQSDVEYIVVDPGSTDGSIELIKSYGDKIDQVVLDPDSGPADGLNKGFAKATGRIGLFLNSDDFLFPTAIATMRAFWLQHETASVLMCRGWMVDGNGQPLRAFRTVATSLHALQNGAPMFQQGLSFSMKAFREIGGFNVQNRTCWDYELLCHLLAGKGEVSSCSDRIAAFRLHGASLTGGAAGLRHKERYEQDMARIAAAFGVKPSAMPALLRWIKNPRDFVLAGFDKFFPTRMQNRFQADAGAL
jgi:cellulose synthase/poly-beta-1,6-N-acetylglucosamine synthase-like glycosyltransferase